MGVVRKLFPHPKCTLTHLWFQTWGRPRHICYFQPPPPSELHQNQSFLHNGSHTYKNSCLIFILTSSFISVPKQVICRTKAISELSMSICHFTLIKAKSKMINIGFSFSRIMAILPQNEALQLQPAFNTFLKLEHSWVNRKTILSCQFSWPRVCNSEYKILSQF